MPLQTMQPTLLSLNIGKTAVTGPVLAGPLGLAGDVQAALRVHGGVDKTVYAYPAAHYAFWREQQVTAPREPCFKFNAVMGFAQAARCMAEAGCCGVYLAVQTPGSIETGQVFTLVHGPRRVSIANAFAALCGRRSH